MISRLTQLQRDVLEAFFRRENRFFLTGGAALAGFHLGHRETLDLDLFTGEDVLDEGVAALRAVTVDLGASLEAIQTAPEFRRLLLSRGADTVVVDLVRDRVPQIVPEKLWFGVLRVDPAEEILVNKLTTLLSRSEPRDLVDARALEAAGVPLAPALVGAARKDGGLTPAQLAWVLGQVTIGDDTRPPGGVSAAELRTYVDDLVRRLTRIAHAASG